MRNYSKQTRRSVRGIFARNLCKWRIGRACTLYNYSSCQNFGGSFWRLRDMITIKILQDQMQSIPVICALDEPIFYRQS